MLKSSYSCYYNGNPDFAQSTYTNFVQQKSTLKQVQCNFYQSIIPDLLIELTFLSDQSLPQPSRRPATAY